MPVSLNSGLKRPTTQEIPLPLSVLEDDVIELQHFHVRCSEGGDMMLSASAATAALLLACIYPSYALYFHIGETEKKCFIEEIPDETMVIGELVAC